MRHYNINLTCIFHVFGEQGGLITKSNQGIRKPCGLKSRGQTR